MSQKWEGACLPLFNLLSILVPFALQLVEAIELHVIVHVTTVIAQPVIGLYLDDAFGHIYPGI